ncbi:MAG: cupin domain-containing protein [Bradyrhizobium sp.]
MEAVMEKTKPVTFVFEDDGLVPNNPLPFIIYKRVIDIDTAHPERTIEDVFAGHRWGSMWRNGIYDYLHYHSTAHEVLGVARGQARVRFGGDRGKVLEVTAGDVAILPAGIGHQCLFATRDLSVVGAYPPGQTMEITRPTPDNHAQALKMIPRVAAPSTDPVMGEDGPLVRLWRR